MNYEGTTNNNNEITEEGTTSSDNEITEEGTTSNNTDMKEGMNSSSNNHDISEDHVTLFVAYNGKWEYDGKEWFFENSKSSIMVVPKHITLSEITDILHQQLKVQKVFYRLKLEVHYRTGSHWFPVTEIQNDQDFSVFISETSKTKLPLCVTRVYDDEINSDDDEISSDDYDEERRKVVTIFVAYDGKWEWDGKEWLFKDSRGSIMLVSKYVTLSEIKDILCKRIYVNRDPYNLKLEVYYRVGFPIIGIESDEDLSLFISESSKTKLTLCVTAQFKETLLRGIPDQIAHRSLDDERVEKRLHRATQNDDWLKALEILKTEDVTWTSKLDQLGNSAFHLFCSRNKDVEVLKDIIMMNRELLETSVNAIGQTPAHGAALLGNTEALKIMCESNPTCLFIHDNDHLLPINYTLANPSKKSFGCLFEKMKSYKNDYDKLFEGMCGLKLLHQVIDRGLIDVAYELINDYPSLATTVYKDKTALECIIRKPELFYSGTHYNFFSRFVYHAIPIENNNFVSNDTADVENQETPKKDKLLHISRICVKLWETTLLHVPHIRHLKDDKVTHNTTTKLLRRICKEADRTRTSSDIVHLYSSPYCLAVENNTIEAVDVLTTYFWGLVISIKDEQSIFQIAVLNRSEKVYSYFLHVQEGTLKQAFKLFIFRNRNNILHLAGRLAPIHRLNAASGAALQMQRELQWFEDVKKTVPIEHTRALNDNNETPMMVFSKAHKELRKDGEEWMKKAADSYTITAALIITMVFAAAITVPGGNDSDTGKPIYETKASLIIFAISDAISLFTATTSLLLFLSILTARYADEDFLYKLPKRLIIGLVMLFASVTSMMIAFSAALYIMFGQEKEWILIPTGALACLPIISFATLQFPLLFELISSTYGHGYFGKEKDWQSSVNANKKKRA